MRRAAVAAALLACHCGGAIPVQMVQVAGAGGVVPFGQSEAFERAALERRAARDLGCEAPTLERSRTPVPIFRASGCGKHRVYVAGVRGWLPSASAEIRVIDFVDVARADPHAPFAGVPRLPGETETTPCPGVFDDREGSRHGEGWDTALARQALEDRLTLAARAADDAHCPRDEVVPWQGEWPKLAPFVEACGKFLSYGRTGTTEGVTHEQEPWSSMGADWRDPRYAEVGFVPWPPSSPGYHGPNAAVLHVKANDPGLVAIGVARHDAPAENPDPSTEFRPVCQPPCDLPVDPNALFAVLSAPRTRAVRPSVFFHLPPGKPSVTVRVAPARYANVVLGSLLFPASGLTGSAALLTFLEAPPTTAQRVVGFGLIGASVGLVVAGLLLVLQQTSVTVE